MRGMANVAAGGDGKFQALRAACTARCVRLLMDDVKAREGCLKPSACKGRAKFVGAVLRMAASQLRFTIGNNGVVKFSRSLT
jgi:hypothetical protein